MKKSTTGFTIIELLVVIVVIAILTAISTVAYTGIQTRANDAKTKASVRQFEAALQIWVQDHPLPIRGGYGSTVVVSNGECSNGASGYIATGTYTCTVEDALISAGILPSGFMKNVPANTYHGSGVDGRNSTMLYVCGDPSRYGLYWTPRSPTAEDSASIESTLTACGNNGANIRDTYGMRAGKILQF